MNSEISVPCSMPDLNPCSECGSTEIEFTLKQKWFFWHRLILTCKKCGYQIETHDGTKLVENWNCYKVN